MLKKSFIVYSCILAFICVSTSCSGKQEDPIIIWTNKSEFVAYAELFNLTSDNAKAVVVYKENPAASFPPTQDEATPDIIIGPHLKNANMRANYIPLDYLFDDQLISKTQFYASLLQYGAIGSQQYLLPVNFNLSTVIFSQENISVIPEDYYLSLDQIRDISGEYNTLDNELYTYMGFAPSWSPEFLYETSKLYNVNFSENKNDVNSFLWNPEELTDSVNYIKDWTRQKNTSTIDEGEYQFKYLYNPSLINIRDNNSLFLYMSTSDFFTTPSERLEGIHYRWIEKDNKIFVHDDMISIGMYKNSKNLPAAEQFIIWLMSEENQSVLLNWHDSLNLYTRTFGIAGGFSSIRSVNERILPLLYPPLWGNIPNGDMLVPPNTLPTNWENIKQNIVYPYLIDASNTNYSSPVKSIEELLIDWYRFDY